MDFKVSEGSAFEMGVIILRPKLNSGIDRLGPKVYREMALSVEKSELQPLKLGLY